MSASNLYYDTSIVIRRRLMSGATWGSGVLLSDRRVLCVYRTGSGVQMGYSPNVKTMKDFNDTLTDVVTLWNGGLATVCRQGLRILLLVMNPGNGTLSGGTAPSVGKGTTMLESYDNGASWTIASNTVPLGSTWNDSGFGFWSPPGPILDTGDGYWYSTTTISGNYFGAGVGQGAVMASTNEGATWSLITPGFNTVWGNEWSTNLAKGADGYVYWRGPNENTVLDPVDDRIMLRISGGSYTQVADVHSQTGPLAFNGKTFWHPIGGGTIGIYTTPNSYNDTKVIQKWYEGGMSNGHLQQVGPWTFYFGADGYVLPMGGSLGWRVGMVGFG